ncbi:MAG TPA: hypothetical protein VG738_17620 [Chitinophagaceae bacterium]|nr:hypothetical protein [Chitinophagaceae bacterium]
MLSDQTKWEFLQGKRHLTAKMLDKTWLEEFHNRNIDIKPEDALMVTLRTTHSYSPNFEEQRTEFEVIKVLSVIRPDNAGQMELGD